MAKFVFLGAPRTAGIRRTAPENLKKAALRKPMIFWLLILTGYSGSLVPDTEQCGPSVMSPTGRPIGLAMIGPSGHAAHLEALPT